MIGFIGSILGDTLLGGFALLMVGSVFLLRESIHGLLSRRRQQRKRERTRREFWGYE